MSSCLRMVPPAGMPASREVLKVCADFLRAHPAGCGIVESPPPPVLNPTYLVYASTDIIGGTYADTEYAREWLLCEPVLELQDGLVILAFASGGHPHLVRMERRGRDVHGRFVEAGSPNEAVYFGVFACRPETIGKDIVLLGRLVDQTRPFSKGDC